MPAHLISTRTKALDDAMRIASDLMAAAHREERLLTPEERTRVDAAMADARRLAGEIRDARSQEALARELAQLGGVTDRPAPGIGDQPATAGLSLGAQFVASAAYQVLRDPRFRTGAWRSNPQEFDLALVSNAPTSGGALLVPEYRPGILELLFRQLTALQLFPSTTTDKTSIVYMREKVFTNAAAPVAQGGTKPESNIEFDSVTDPVRKIAHWLPVTDEMLEDVPGLRGFIDARLLLGLDLKLEDQVLNGSGTGENILGLLNRSGLSPVITQGASEFLADAIHRQITYIAWTALLVPDAIVMNPMDWETIELSKDNSGRYYGNGPFATAPRVLWGLPVALSPALTRGEIVVGGFRIGAQIFYRTGVILDVSNSHADFFVKNLTAIRAERRMGLAVYRPQAFGTVDIYTP